MHRMTKRAPVAYLRKSHVNATMNHVSWEVQEEAVRSLATSHGDANLTILSDWSKSGRGSKTKLRTEYLRMREMIAGGQVSVLYSYSLSRLARSTKELLDLAEACATAGVRVRLAKEGDMDFTTSHGRLYLTVLAGVSTFEAEVASERTRDAMAVRVARGDRMGIAPYGSQAGESLEPIIAAYRQAGSCYGAARILNDSGHRTRRGAMWTSKVIGEILTREGVTYAKRPHAGAKDAAEWITFRLLTCPCGNTMTSMDRRTPRVTCYRARHVTGHPKPYGISEAKLMPALMAEAAHLAVPDAVELPVADEAERAALGAKRDRVLDLFADGLIDKAERTRRLLVISDAMEALDAAREVVALPAAIDWTQPPRVINAILRAMWERVELGPDLMPVRFVWRREEWRA